MKCSGLRVFKASVRPCGQPAQEEFDNAFCSAEHMEFAKQHTGTAYASHVANAKRVFSDISLTHGFNTKLRVGFVSVIEAGMKHAEHEFLQSAEPMYANIVRSAWESVDAVAQVNAEQVQANIQEARKAKKAVKRRRDTDADFQAMYVSSLEFDADEQIVPKATRKKSKAKQRRVGRKSKSIAQPSAEEPPIAPLALPTAEDALLYKAVNTALPDGDDDAELMED
jgi:hypothetical protein